VTSRVFKVGRIKASSEFAIIGTDFVGSRRYYVVLYCNRFRYLSELGLNKCSATCPRVCALRTYLLFGIKRKGYEIVELNVDARSVLNDYGTRPVFFDAEQVAREIVSRSLELSEDRGGW